MPFDSSTGYKPLSVNHRRKFIGTGELDKFLHFYSTADVVHFFDDFLVDTINLDAYALANSAGTGAADFAVQVLANGVVRSNSGSTDNGATNLITPLIWAGDNQAGLEARLKFDVVTGHSFEVGLIDAVPASTGPGVSDIDTPAFTAADSALIHLDTDQTLTTIAFATNGSTTGQPDQATSASLPADPVAATYFTVTIQLVDNYAYSWIDGVSVNHPTSDADGYVEGGTLLGGWVYNRTRNTTAKLMDLDYLRIWADRV